MFVYHRVDDINISDARTYEFCFWAPVCVLPSLTIAQCLPESEEPTGRCTL